MLQLGVCVLEVGVLCEDVLDDLPDLGEEVDELDVGGEQEGPGGHGAQVVLGM